MVSSGKIVEAGRKKMGGVGLVSGGGGFEQIKSLKRRPEMEPFR